ncbi:G-protein coupled receptor 157-like [Sycon ciliatum]|uniref:G-protein coupled receptor 157-like n=1 Tax=Sycon ciliatum TaxID=27933 RepID=UPI0031F62BFB
MVLDVKDSVNAVVVTSSILSLFGSATIIVSYALWPRIRTTSRFILACLSFADYASAVGYGASAMAALYYGPHFMLDNPFSCRFQSIVTTWSSMATFCWTVALAVYLHITIVRDNIELGKRLVPVYAAVCLGIPTAVTVGALLSGALGYSLPVTTSGWCWISEEPEWPVFQRNASFWVRDGDARLFWMLLAGKFWEITSCILIFILYFLIRRHLRRQTRTNGRQFLTTTSRSIAQSADRKMLVIPVAFLLLRVWGTTRFIIDTVHIRLHNDVPNPYYPLLYLQAVGDTGQGFVNFIIFCWKTDSVQSLLVMACCWCFRHRRRHKHKDTAPLPSRSLPSGLQVEPTDQHPSQPVSSTRIERSSTACQPLSYGAVDSSSGKDGLTHSRDTPDMATDDPY